MAGKVEEERCIKYAEARLASEAEAKGTRLMGGERWQILQHGATSKIHDDTASYTWSAVVYASETHWGFHGSVLGGPAERLLVLGTRCNFSRFRI